jgi:hypothetical protein
MTPLWLFVGLVWTVVSIVAYTALQFATLMPFLLTGWAWPLKYRRHWTQCWYELACERKEFFYNWLDGSRPYDTGHSDVEAF